MTRLLPSLLAAALASSLVAADGLSLRDRHAPVGQALDTHYFAAGHLVDIAACDLREMRAQGKRAPAGLEEFVRKADADLRAAWLSLERRRAAIEKKLDALPEGSQALTIETLDSSAAGDAGWFMVRSAEFHWPDGSTFSVPLERFQGGAGPRVYSYQCPPAKAVWVYGANTKQHRMTAGFDLPKLPAQEGELTIGGQDHDKPGAVRIRITLNGTVLFQGGNGFVKMGWSDRAFPVPASAFAEARPNPDSDALDRALGTLAADVDSFGAKGQAIAREVTRRVSPITAGLAYAREPSPRGWWKKPFLRAVYFDGLYLKGADDKRPGREAEWGAKMAHDLGLQLLSGYVAYYSGNAWGERFLRANDAVGTPYVEMWQVGYPISDPDKFATDVRAFGRKWSRHPTWVGLGVDEPGALNEELATPAGLQGFREYLAGRADALRRAGVALPGAPGPIENVQTDRDRVLWAEWQMYRTEAMGRFFSGAWSRLGADGISFFPVIMGKMPTEPQYNSYAAMGQALPVISTDIYNNSFVSSALFMQLLRSAASGRAYFVPGAGYSDRSPSRLRRDLAMPMVHADGVCMWTWLYFAKYRAPASFWPNAKDDRGTPLLTDWDPEYWYVTKEMYARMRRADAYLGGATPVSPVALLFSERTPTMQTADDAVQRDDYWGNNVGVYMALLRRSAPFDARLIETTTPEKLREYRAALLCDARSLTQAQLNMLRDWVRAGGTLIATGETSLCDEWGRPQGDLGLRDVLGVSYGGTARGVSRFDLPAGAVGADATIGVEYPRQNPYIKARPLAAEVLARWDNGDPALLRNRFGGGQAFLITARRAGLYYDVGLEGTGLCVETHPGFPRLIRALVDNALRDAKPAFRIEGAPDGLEVQVRQVKGAYVVHLLDWYDDRTVSGLRLAINAPGKVEVLYPADEKPKLMRVKGPMVIPIRAFRCHEMVAVRGTDR